MTWNFCAASEEDWKAERARVKKSVKGRREAALGRRRDCALSECSSMSSWGIVVELVIAYRLALDLYGIKVLRRCCRVSLS